MGTTTKCNKCGKSDPAEAKTQRTPENSHCEKHQQNGRCKKTFILGSELIDSYGRKKPIKVFIWKRLQQESTIHCIPEDPHRRKAPWNNELRKHSANMKFHN